MKKIIYGIHTIQNMIFSNPSNLQEIYIFKNYKSKRLLKIIQFAKSKGIKNKLVDRKWLNKIAKSSKHQGILGKIYFEKKYSEKDIDSIIKNEKTVFFLILDCITDPRNLGACIRTANAVGVHAVIIPKKKSASLNSISKKIASGATEYTPLIRVNNLSKILINFKKKNILIVGTSEKSNISLYETNLTGSIALIMGREDKGIRSLTMKFCDKLIYIPTIGQISSLNVSVASAICLFESFRQKISKK